MANSLQMTQWAWDTSTKAKKLLSQEPCITYAWGNALNQYK